MILPLLLAATLASSEDAIRLANAWKLDEAEVAARTAYREALDCDDTLGRARALDALGVVARLRGRTAEALDFTTEALVIAAASGDPDTLGRTLNDRGRIDADLVGDADAARESYERALAVHARDGRVAARALNNLGNLATAERDLVAARELYERSASAAQAAGDAQGAIAAEHNAGMVLLLAGEPAEARKYLIRAEELDRRAGGAQRARILLSQSEAERAMGHAAEALELLREARKASAGDEVTGAILSLREAAIHAERHEFGKADDALRAARAIALRLGDAALQAMELVHRARLRLAGERFAEAAALASDAVARARASRNIDVVAAASAIAGAAYRRSGDRAAAKRAYQDAIDAIEQQRERVSISPDTRLRFFERETDPYRVMVELSIEDGDAHGALRYAEAARGRLLRDAVARRRLRAATPAGVTFVEYVVTEAKTYALTSRGDEVTATAIAVTRAQLDALTARFARELALRNLAFRGDARSLYDLLVAPLPLGDARRLCIIPDQELWRVAFQALIDCDDRYMIERLELSYAPSIAVASSSGRRGDRVLLASSLSEATQEIAEIAAVWRGARVTVLDRATEESVRNAAPRYDLVHIAAHGVYDAGDPMRSHLVLDDGRLTARELTTLRLPGSLVVLSACESGVGRPAAGEGLIGMSWSLLMAGAGAVVAGTWEVDSESTARLMIAFHRALATGAAPAAALRTAQLAFLRGPQAHPFYWAGFAVTGAGW